MNKELNIGDYVRTKHYGIFKVLNIEKVGETIFFKKAQGIDVVVADKNNKIEDEIININSTPIELLEIGDYVNGCYVDEILNADECYDDRKHFHLLKFNSYFRNEDIKSIVTKEQFESMEYKVGDKE